MRTVLIVNDELITTRWMTCACSRMNDKRLSTSWAKGMRYTSPFSRRSFFLHKTPFTMMINQFNDSINLLYLSKETLRKQKARKQHGWRHSVIGVSCSVRSFSSFDCPPSITKLKSTNCINKNGICLFSKYNPKLIQKK